LAKPPWHASALKIYRKKKKKSNLVDEFLIAAQENRVRNNIFLAECHTKKLIKKILKIKFFAIES
jgi:hypothetical protein